MLLSAQVLLAQYTTNGSATQVDNSCTTLTQAVPTQNGSAFFNTPLDLSQPFDYNGTMYFGADDAGADGLAFVLTTDVTAQGGSGGGIGYEGIIPSVAVEFDTWQNEDFGDPVQDHIAIMSGGIAMHGTASQLAAPVLLPNIENGLEHCFRVRWDPAVPVFEATLGGTTVTYNGDISTFFPPGVDVFYGYTGSTGGAFNEQRVCLYNTDAFGPIELDGPFEFCQSDGIQTYNVTIEGGTWGGGANAQGQVDPADFTPGNYAVTYTLGVAECEVIQFQSFTVLPAAEVELLAQTDVTCNEPTGSLEVEVSGGVPPLTLNWSNGENTSLIEGLSPGSYTLTVTAGNGCETVTTYEIEAAPELEIQPLDVSPAVCDENNELLTAAFLVTVSGGTRPYTYSVNDEGAIQADSIFSNLTRENGTLTVTDADNCTATLNYTVAAPDFPAVDIIASATQLCEDAVTLSVDLGNTETALWSTGETTGAVSIAEPGDYSVTVTNDFNCSAEAETTVTECLGYEMPDIFTPNGDAVNDTFGPVVQGENVSFNLKIYSRWGSLVYEGNENWDGNADGKPFPADVLIYLAEITIGDETFVEQGDVTLVR